MKRRELSIAIILIIVVIMAGGYWWFSHSGSGGSRGNSGDSQAEKTTNAVHGPVAQVKVVPIREGAITENISAYGEVIPAPGALQTVSVPFESQVRHIMVNTGQKVSTGDMLLEIEPSPDTYLELEQARNAYELARQSLQNVQQRLDHKLTTRDQLLQAELTAQQAELRLTSMKKRGIEDQRQIFADAGGLINKVYVQEGAIVSAGNPLVEIVAQNRLEVRLGVEPEDIGKVQANQPVSLAAVNKPAAVDVTGQIRRIANSVNPTTRLVDVFVALPSSERFLLGESIVGKVALATVQGFTVPRAAVLPEDNHYILFTVKNNRAVKHIVRIGLDNKKAVEIIGSDLRAGDAVVVLGNYELEDGMAVKVEGAH
jgi:membrane fusion protein (multidrug efflux system)